MTFRDALEREISAQSLSVAEVAQKSGLSKGAIYNILNGKTEEERIRPSTRRAIARGCNRNIEVSEEGAVLFVEHGRPGPVDEPGEVELRLVPGRPFLAEQFLREPFDWLYSLEEEGVLTGTRTVDRVFQKREEFLSLVVENRGQAVVTEVRFDLRVTFEGGGPAKQFSSRLSGYVPCGGHVEETLFLQAGPSYCAELLNPVFTDPEGQTKELDGDLKYSHKG